MKRRRSKKKPFKNIARALLVVALAVAAESVAGIDTLPKKLMQEESGYSGSIVETAPESIPEFAGRDYVVLNDNMPNFTETDLQNITGESYSSLDSLGRCGTAVAMIDQSMMPTEERGSIGQVKPSGWVQAKYEGYVDSNPPYLYNRCHLIAYALTGQNANEENLITGTRYFNVTGMLPFEEQVMQYLDDSPNRVLYRVTPYFRDNELVARGVEMEAYSVEDDGEGVCFHVFVYNYQPGIEIDYRTGESRIFNVLEGRKTGSTFGCSLSCY